jgi:pantoate--beta-alanine ligase
MDILKTKKELRNTVRGWQAQNLRVGFVPTMGALHAGHVELVRAALAQSDRVIVSIFVNPTQFAPNEDFSAYPRPFDADVEKLTTAKASAVYAPSVAEMYPDGFATNVSVKGVTEGLCGASRPTHFDGVATVVSKLLLQARPDAAFFGEKDWQQLQVVKRLVTDLDIGVEIIGVPIVRDASGLALSSRNAYLTAEQLQIASRLNKILFAAAEKIKNGADITATLAWGKDEIVSAGFDRVDYLECREAETLTPCAVKGAKPLRLLAAAFLGKARLIDNVAVV